MYGRPKRRQEGETCKSERPVTELFLRSGAVIDIDNYSLFKHAKSD